MFINAELIKKMIQVELPLDSSDLFFLEKFLKSKGFKFDREIGKFKCAYQDKKNNRHLLFWHMRGTLNHTIVCTFFGTAFPYEENIRKIVYPKQPHHSYILELDEKRIDTVIKLLFNNRFEITELSEGGIDQLYRLNENKVLIGPSQSDSGKRRVTFSGIDNISQAILGSFCIA